MGQTKSGYDKLSNFSPEQTEAMQFITQLMQGQGGIGQNPLYQNAAAGVNQFLPGGGGGQPIINDAMRRYQQQTLPSILNAFGSGSKSSSALNQALGASAADLNTSLASQLAQMQLQASGQAGALAQLPGQERFQAAQASLGATPFEYQQKQLPFWQQALLAAYQGAGAGLAGAAKGGF